MDKGHPTLRYKTSRRMVMPVGQLRIGMYVAELDRPWEGTPFLFQGFAIETEHDIEVIREYCQQVTIDIESSVDFQIQPRAKTGATGQQQRAVAVNKRGVSVERELGRAQQAHVATSRLIRSIMDDVRLGRTVDTPAAREAVTECVDSIISNQDALSLLSRIREKDEYTAQHSLSVSVLTIGLGRHLRMQRDELIELGLCGLLHDVGKVLSPIDILTKPGRLTESEMAIMKEHTTHGRNILLGSSGTPLKALDVAHAHHERLDGLGYPRGLTEAQITPYTRMVAITDTFDAVTSDRSYDNARTNMDAFRILSKGRNSRWDPRLVIRFIESIGIYPAGTPVQLSNGMRGIVIETHDSLRLRPKILLTQGPHGALKPPMILNLALQVTDPYGQRLEIQQVLSPGVAGTSLHELQAQGLLDKLQDLPVYGKTGGA